MKTTNKKAQTMGEVISRVYELIELAQQKKISTRINDQEVADISVMLQDIDRFTQQKFGMPFLKLKCKCLDLVFLNAYKEHLWEKRQHGETEISVRNLLLALLAIFIFSDGYGISNLDIDMFELFLEQSAREGLVTFD